MNIIFTALVGSHLYGLDTPSSDRDYKVFTIEDNARVNLSDKEDYDYMCIKILPHLLLLPHISYIAMLFSPDIRIGEPYKHYIQQIIAMKEDIVHMNISGLYDAIMSAVHEKVAMIKTPDLTILQKYNKLDLYNTYGYDTKQAMHVIRLLDIIMRYYDNNFSNFASTIMYTGSEKERLLSLKEGYLTKDEYFFYLTERLSLVERIEDAYKKHKINIDTQHELSNICDNLFSIL